MGVKSEPEQTFPFMFLDGFYTGVIDVNSLKVTKKDETFEWPHVSSSFSPFLPPLPLSLVF